MQVSGDICYYLFEVEGVSSLEALQKYDEKEKSIVLAKHLSKDDPGPMSVAQQDHLYHVSLCMQYLDNIGCSNPTSEMFG